MKKFFSNLSGTLLQTFKSNPSEIIISFVFFVAFTVWDEKSLYDLEANLAYMPLLFGASFLMGKFCKGKLRWIYYLSPLLAVPFMFLDTSDYLKSHTSAYTVTLIAFIAALFIYNWKRDNNDFTEHSMKLGFDSALSLIMCSIAYGLARLIFVSLELLFDIYIPHQIYTYGAYFTYIFAVPTLALAFYNGIINQNTLHATVIRVIVNYILTPALIIYNAILYVYFLKILVTWSLPKGTIVYMATTMIVCGFGIKAIVDAQGRRWASWYFDRLGLFFIPALAMFWVSIIYRVADYGFTEARIYTIIVGILMTVLMFASIMKRRRSYLYVLVLGVGLLALVTYIPGITASELEAYSQDGRENRVPECDNNEYSYDLSAYMSFDEYEIDISGFSVLHNSLSCDVQNDTLIIFRYEYAAEVQIDENDETVDSDSVEVTNLIVGEDSISVKEQMAVHECETIEVPLNEGKNVYLSISSADFLKQVFDRAGIDPDTVSSDYLRRHPDIFRYFDSGKYRVYNRYMNVEKSQQDSLWRVRYFDIEAVLER